MLAVAFLVNTYSPWCWHKSMGHSEAQDLNRLRIRFKFWAFILLLVDIDSLQQLNRMYGQPMGKISPSQHIWLHMWSCLTSSEWTPSYWICPCGWTLHSNYTMYNTATSVDDDQWIAFSLATGELVPCPQDCHVPIESATFVYYITSY